MKRARSATAICGALLFVVSCGTHAIASKPQPLRGAIDRSRLPLLRHAVVRRDSARSALQRDVELRIDAGTPGGEVFAVM